MSKIKNFKTIADEIMSDINASEELKEKTLMRCMKKRHVSMIKFMVPAACFVLVFGIMNISSLLPQKTQRGEEGNTGINLMIGSGDGIEILPGQNESTIIPETDTIKNWLLETPIEAKKSFGSSFLTPSYIPEDFKLDKIHVSGSDDHNATKVVLSYFAGERSFLIIEEKTEMQNWFANFKKIDINGAAGYLKPAISDNGVSLENIDTELHWFIDGVHYSVAGLITDDEAIKVAMSMK